MEVVVLSLCWTRCWVVLFSCGGVFLLSGAVRGAGLFLHLCATSFSGGMLAFSVFVNMFCFLSRQVLALVLLIVV